MYNQRASASTNCLSKNDQVMLSVIESEGALRVDSYHTMPQADVDSLFRLRELGLVKFNVGYLGCAIRVSLRLKSEAPGNLDLPEQWREWERLRRTKQIPTAHA
jgi:hypothetical protein